MRVKRQKMVSRTEGALQYRGGEKHILLRKTRYWGMPAVNFAKINKSF